MIEIRDMTTEYDYGAPFIVPQMDIEEGKITTIIGRNGSGKSTLLKTIAGMKKYKGSIRINGKECRGIGSMERAREAAYLPQNLKNAGLDVETLVEHGRYAWHGNLRRLTEKDKRHVSEALELTGMTGYRNRSLQELSGGERQRAYLAMVIAQDSPMILLDEPTTFMDLNAQKSFFELLKKLALNGRGIAMICHNIDAGLSYSDMVYLMENRTVAGSGVPEEIIKDDDLFRRTFGAGIKKVEDENALYPYIFVK